VRLVHYQSYANIEGDCNTLYWHLIPNLLAIKYLGIMTPLSKNHTHFGMEGGLDVRQEREVLDSPLFNEIPF